MKIELAFEVESEALQRQVICEECGEEESVWYSCKVRERFGVG